MVITNPRQFASLDASDAGLHGSLTNRPPSSVSVGDPIDFEAINRQVINNRTQPSYVYRESAVESTLRKQQDIAASLRIKQQTADAKAANALQDQRNQAQRNELKNRIKNSPTSSEVAQPPRESRLSKAPPSTRERQPTPSTGRPPPTANGTAARASSLIEPTATPAPAMLAERIPPPSRGGFFEGLPRSLPQAAGRFAIPGVYAVADFGIRTYLGQPFTQAASGAVASTAGAFAGGVAGTAIAGPIGGVLGSMIGGYVGGAIANSFFHGLPNPSTPPIESPNYPPFQGGQSHGLIYLAVCHIPSAAGILTYEGELTGDIAYFDKTTGIGWRLGYSPSQFAAYHKDGTFAGSISWNLRIAFINPVADGPPVFTGEVRLVSLKRKDGQADNGGDIIAPAPPPDNQPYYFPGTPLNESNTIPSGKPTSGKNKGKNRDVVPGVPSNNTPNGNGYFPGHGGLAPSLSPNPSQSQSNLGGLSPSTAPERAPMPFAEPKDLPPPRFTPAPLGLVSPPPDSDVGISPEPGVSRIQNGVVTNPPTLNAQPIPLGSSLTTLPGSSPKTSKQNPTPDGVSPVSKLQAAPTPDTPEATAKKINQIIQDQKKDFDDQIARLTTIGGLIAGLTPIIQGIPDAIAKSPTVQAANKKTTQGAVCEIAQPGGCLGNALDNSADKINQNNNQNTANLLDKISAGANAAQLALLELINTKLGNLLPGGLSGTFTRLWQTLQVDRMLNMIILITTFHNALMLSNNLAQTLFSAIDNIGQAVGFKWKNEKGEDTGFGGIASEWTANFFKGIFGAENYTALISNYKKANRIYQASANILNSIQSIGASILNALEVVGGWNANIGNALKRFGVVGEKAYAWMNPNINFQNKYFTALENVTNTVSQIDQIASETLSIKESVGQITEQKKELDESLKQDDTSKQKTDIPEAVKLAKEQKESKQVSAALPLSENDKQADE